MSNVYLINIKYIKSDILIGHQCGEGDNFIEEESKDFNEKLKKKLKTFIVNNNFLSSGTSLIKPLIICVKTVININLAIITIIIYIQIFSLSIKYINGHIRTQLENLFESR